MEYSKQYEILTMKTIILIFFSIFCVITVSGSNLLGKRGIWLEAESFASLGGWVIDQQSIDQMGSPYIMAHGMGIPVKDASTTFEVPYSGEWNVWVRTRDWTAVWKRGNSGGIFKISINGETLNKTLGTNSVAWDWQKAGAIGLNKGTATISLHDLSGFNGRCDAIYLTSDKDFRPTNRTDELVGFRKQESGIKCVDDTITYDLAIAGGGIAGICTAVSAIANGLKVILIQDRPVLGGVNSSEIRVSLGGNIHVDPYPNLGNVVEKIAPVYGYGRTLPAEYYEDKRKELIFRFFPSDRYRLVLNERVVAAESDSTDPKKITAYIGRNVITGQEMRYKARLFADCTGDAVIAQYMGAEVMYGTESRADFNEVLAPEKASRQVMGHSVIWYSGKDTRKRSFPDINWGLEFDEEKVYYIRKGDWEWETGQFRDMVNEIEYIRDYGMMAIYANWSYLKNHSKRKDEWANDTLSWVSPIGGKRESYRVVGDHVLTYNDIIDNVPYPDGTAAITWNTDIHYPDPENSNKFEEPFRSAAYHRGNGHPYQVPYRCLYPKDLKNLFVVGRHISVTHVALASVRVMRTLGMLGEVVGMAAKICVDKNAYPRDVYVSYLDSLKQMMEKGVPIPKSYHAYGTAKSESYHFKELGHIRLFPSPPDKRLSDSTLIKRIEQMGAPHKMK